MTSIIEDLAQYFRQYEMYLHLRTGIEKQTAQEALIAKMRLHVADYELDSLRLQRQDEQLESQNKHIRALQREIMKQLFYRELDFAGNERVTVFAHRPADKMNPFRAVSRLAKSNNFSNITSIRQPSIYTPFLKLAFDEANGEKLIENLPPFQHTDAYLHALRGHCLPHKLTIFQLKQMRMQPRSFHFIEINDGGDQNGVVMLESKLEKFNNPTLNTDSVLRVRRLLLKIIETSTY